MANKSGLTIETASRWMPALRNDGLIATDEPRDIAVQDLEALKAEIADDMYERKVYT